ncbi:MAG: GNAT family N-acetyltransferase [Saprospiraceae bacterium]|nr:GNAT family N-acetyltransferase [Saprospiraceae bacterium]
MEVQIKHFNELSSLELYRIIQLRINVFVVEQNCPYPELDDKDLVSHHVMIWNKNVLIAVTRIVPPGVSYPKYPSIGRVATHLNFRHHGLGKQVMRESINACETLFPGYNIKISAQAYLVSFYEAFDFEAIGEEYLEDNIPHLAMIRHAIQRG